MKSKALVGLSIVTFVLWASLSSVSATVTNDVFQVTLSAKATVEVEEGGMPLLSKETVNAAGLVNLARGRFYTDPCPANEVLAIAFNVTAETGQLIVFDTNTSSVLATIAEVDDGSGVADLRKGVFVLWLVVTPVGTASNSIDAGGLLISGSYSIAPDGSPDKVKATMSGYLTVTTTDDAGTESSDIVFTNGKMTMGAKLGTMVE